MRLKGLTAALIGLSVLCLAGCGSTRQASSSSSALRVLSQESEQVRAEGLKFRDSLMLKDIWAELDVHETVRGIKGKLALAGNTWRARWKYRHFSNISMIQALWIQVKGFLFEKNPSLN